jgi:hypothetical protein
MSPNLAHARRNRIAGEASSPAVRSPAVRACLRRRSAHWGRSCSVGPAGPAPVPRTGFGQPRSRCSLARPSKRKVPGGSRSPASKLRERTEPLRHRRGCRHGPEASERKKRVRESLPNRVRNAGSYGSLPPRGSSETAIGFAARGAGLRCRRYRCSALMREVSDGPRFPTPRASDARRRRRFAFHLRPIAISPRHARRDPRSNASQNANPAPTSSKRAPERPECDPSRGRREPRRGKAPAQRRSTIPRTGSPSPRR